MRPYRILRTTPFDRLSLAEWAYMRLLPFYHDILIEVNRRKMYPCYPDTYITYLKGRFDGCWFGFSMLLIYRDPVGLEELELIVQGMRNEIGFLQDYYIQNTSFGELPENVRQFHIDQIQC